MKKTSGKVQGGKNKRGTANPFAQKLQKREERPWFASGQTVALNYLSKRKKKKSIRGSLRSEISTREKSRTPRSSAELTERKDDSFAGGTAIWPLDRCALRKGYLIEEIKKGSLNSRLIPGVDQ